MSKTGVSAEVQRTRTLQVKAERRDPLRRFAPTPHAADVSVMGRTLRVETNSPKVFARVTRALRHYGGAPSAQPQFLWRIVSESGGLDEPGWPEMAAFSDEGLRYVNVGQQSFIAVDLEAREAVAYIREALANEEVGFTSIFLAALFYLTAAALSLTSVTAGCVALGTKGLLIFGAPGSGKTTSAYAARKLGLRFHADMVTFLELRGSSLAAWGEFWPASFRAEALRFLPELEILARPFRFQDSDFLYLEKRPDESSAVDAVSPAVCVFLERQARESPRLIPITSKESAERIENSLPFKDDRRFESQRAAVCGALSRLPAYRLGYGENPASAAMFFRSLLNVDFLLEAGR